MARTTPPPRKNVPDLLPELADQARTTVRLHPRRGEVPDPAASKIGGTFLWPADEPWPVCTDPTCGAFGEPPPEPATLIPVLQLRKEDVPEVEFFPGTDLFQVLWCPHTHDEPIFAAKPYFFWRNSAAVADPLAEMPPSPTAPEHYRVRECQLHLERITEYPPIQELPDEIVERIENWNAADALDPALPDPAALYEKNLSVCPGSKVGGYPAWVRDAQRPVCRCGGTMEHLLTLADAEVNAATYDRWLPIEDRHVQYNFLPKIEIVCQGSTTTTLRTEHEQAVPYEELQAVINAPNFRAIYGGRQFIFLCRTCPGWPLQCVFQS